MIFKAMACSLNMYNYVFDHNCTNKLYHNEYISSNSVLFEEMKLNEKLTNITKDDENVVIKYLLEIMRNHDIITDKEYKKVLYKYC